MSGFAGMVFSSRKAPPATVGDPYWSNVSLLLHGEGTNNGTTITDSSSYNNSATRVSTGVVTSTSQFKYGSSSIFIPNDDNSLFYYTWASSDEFDIGTGDWTNEFWVYPTLSTGVHGIFSFGFFTFLAYQNNLQLHIEISKTTDASNGVTISADTGALTQNAWNHCAIVRSGTNIYVYIAGTRTYTSTALGSNTIKLVNTTYPPNNRYGYGSTKPDPTTQILGGYLDDIRFTKGVARYTDTTLTVPTTAFPDFAA